MTTELNHKYSLIWKVTPDLLGVLNDCGQFVDTNPAWRKTLGFRPSEVENQRFLDFIHPEDLTKTKKAFAAIQSGKPILNFESRYRHSDDSYRWLSWNAIPEGGRYYFSARDVTAEKENIEALKSREEEAQLREQFIAVLGHDLRNPLAAVASAGRIMRREPQSDTTLQMLDVMQGSVDRMASLIDNLMDFARSRFGSGISIDWEIGVPLKPVLVQAVTEIQMAHPEAKIETRYDFAEPLSCDTARIGQLVSNLLSNAVAHGDKLQPITLHACDRDSTFLISVENFGDPIPDAAAKMLFRPFFRVAADDKRQGLGLGLFIAAEIAKAHDGHLTTTSRDGKTVFTFEMPRG